MIFILGPQPSGLVGLGNSNLVTLQKGEKRESPHFLSWPHSHTNRYISFSHPMVKLLQGHLSHLKLAKLDGLPGPLVLHVASMVAKAANLKGTLLAVERELALF